MAEEYELLSGEKLTLDDLMPDEKANIKTIEQRIGESKHHDKHDYFSVLISRESPLDEGRFYTAKMLEEVYDTAYYKISSDIIKRYWYKCFSKEPAFEEYIKKEGLGEEYERYKRANEK